LKLGKEWERVKTEDTNKRETENKGYNVQESLAMNWNRSSISLSMCLEQVVITTDMDRILDKRGELVMGRVLNSEQNRTLDIVDLKRS